MNIGKFLTARVPRRRAPLAIGLALALIATAGLVAFAAEYSIVNQGDWVQIDGAVYRAFNPDSASGSGQFESFLRVGANQCVIQGYNTDGRPLEFDELTSKTFTRSYLLSDVPMVGDPDVPGLYREFQLDSNQTQGGSRLTLDEVELYLTDNPDLLGYPFVGTAAKVYELDAGGANNWVLYDSIWAAGSGKRDLILRVNRDLFQGTPYPYCSYQQLGCTTYIVLYTRFGGDSTYCNDDGFEEWGVEPYDFAVKSGYKWEDLNGDGVWDAGEPPLAGWTMYVDFDGNGLRDPEEPFAVTDATGYYEITNVIPGTWKVREEMQDGWFCTFPSPCYYEHLFVQNEIYPNNNFGNARPSVDLTKTGDELSKVGDDVNYTLTLENTSIPGAPPLVCTITDPMLGIDETVTLAPGEQHVINTTYTVPAGAPDPLTNYAEASCTFVDGQVEVAYDDASWTVELFQPCVDVTKTGDELSKVGDTVNYEVTIANCSSEDAPALVFDSFSDTLVPGVVPPEACDWLGYGASCTFGYSYVVPVGAPDPLLNTATAHYHPDEFPNDITDSDGHSVDLFQPCVDVTKTGDELSKVGDTVNYEVTIANCSSQGTPPLVLDSFSDTLVPGVVPPETCDWLEFEESCTFGYSYVVPAGAPDPLLNTATAHYHPDGFPNDIWDADGHSVDLFQPAIEITKVGDELSKIGDPVEYTITLYNNSSEDAPDLVCAISDPTIGFSKNVTLGSGEMDTSVVPFVIPAGAGDPFVNTVSVTCSPIGFPNVLTDSARWETNLFQPAIDLTKEGDELSKIGDPVEYTITLWNNSSADAPDMVCTISDPTIGFTKNVTLASGAMDVSTVPFVIPAGAGDPFVNTASVTCSPEGFPNVYTDEDSWSTNLFQAAIDITKVGEELSKIGDPVEYTITLYNNSSEDTPDLVCAISDPLIGFTKNVTLASGAMDVSTVPFVIPAGAPDPFVNTVSVTCSPEGFPNIYTDWASWETGLFQAAIELVKEGDELSKIGDPVEYTITLWNNSSADAPDMVCTITDPLIGFTKNVTLASGEMDESVVPFVIPAGAGDPFVNTASVTCSPEGFPNVYTDSDSWSTNLFQPAINIAKGGPLLSKIGDPVEYTILLHNGSSADTPDMACTISDPIIGFTKNVTLASGATDESVVPFVIPPDAADPFVNTVSVTCSPEGFPNTYTDSDSWYTNLFQPAIDLTKTGDELSKIGDEVTYTITLYNNSSLDTPDLECTISDPTIGFTKNVDLDSGEMDVSTVPFTIPAGAGDPFVNTASVTCSPEGFPNIYTDEASWSTNLFQAAIDITKVGDELSKIGDDVIYEITLYNDSSEDAPPMVCTITDPLIGFTKNVTLASGEEDLSVVEFTIPAGAPDPFVNTVSVTCSPEGFPNVYTDEASWETNLFQASIHLTKEGDELSKIGDPVEYTITLHNGSSADAPDMVCTISDPLIGFTKNVTLASGEMDESVVPFVIPAGAADPFVNTASVTCSPEGFPNVYTDEASWSTELFQAAIDIHKVGDALSKIGDPVEYTITLHNGSSADAPDMVCTISDPLIGFTKNVTLASGQVNLSVVPFVIPAGAADPFVNTVSVTCSPEGFPNVYTDEASWTTELFQAAIHLEKEGDELSKVGDAVEYTITLHNGSSADAPDMVCTISDALIGFTKNVTLASGEMDESVVPFVIPLGAPDPFVNTASVTCSPEGFPNVYTDTASWSTNLFQACVELTKEGDGYSKVGDTITYEITFHNCSSADAPALVLASFTDSKVAGVVPPTACRELTTAETCSFSYGYTVVAGDDTGLPGATLVNVAAAVFNPAGFPNLVSDSDSWSAVLLHPAYTVSKMCTTPTVDVGGTARYDVVFMNTGDVDLEVVADEVLCDITGCIPAGTAFVLAEGAMRTFEATKVAENGPTVNTVNTVATLPAWTGLSNELPRSASGTCYPTPFVPEASTWLLMLSAAGGLAGYARVQIRARRRK